MSIFGGRSAAEWLYGRNPNASVGAMALMAEVDRGEARRREREAQSPRAERKQWHEELKEERRQREIMLRTCEEATPEDLAEWMRGYRARGGMVRDIVDRPMHSDFYVMRRRPALLVELYGASSVDVIVPSGVLRPEELPRTYHGVSGHSNWYFMKDFAFVGISKPISFECVERIL